MRQHPSQFFQSRATVTLPAFQVVTELSKHPPGAAHGERIYLISPSIFGNRQNSSEMSQVIASGLRLDPASLQTHPPNGEVDQALGVDVDIVQFADVHLSDGGKRSGLGLAQWPRLPCFFQILIDHLFDGDVFTACPLDRTWRVQLCTALACPSLRRLFSGEGLALLVDLHSVALDADLSRVAHSPISQFSCPDSRHFKSGTRQF